jgi:hypothetical protein
VNYTAVSATSPLTRREIFNSARHKVNLLAQQVKSSGSFHANLQGLQVAEFDEITGLEVRTSSAIRQATM